MAARFDLLLFSILFTLFSKSVSRTTIIESSISPPLLIKLFESSSPPSQTVTESKITKGSSISAAATGSSSSFWLSPSGLFSFGFYPLNSYHQDYIIGIWINNNPTWKTLVWSINRDDSPLSKATSLLLNDDGKFVIRFSNGAKEKPLFHQDSLFSSPISYASMFDNGNLVFYNSNSTIIWESFSYPTDTILPGQTLHPEQSLVSSFSEPYESRCTYRLIMKNDGNLMLYTMKHYHQYMYQCMGRGKGVVSKSYKYDDIFVVWESDTRKKNGSPVELKLDSTGHLYLQDWNGLVMKSLSKVDNIDPEQEEKLIYRATLGRDGVFRLYKEKIGLESNSSTEVVVWDTHWWNDTIKVVSVVLTAIIITVFLCYLEFSSRKNRFSNNHSRI